MKSIERNCGFRPPTPEESESYSDSSDIESDSEDEEYQLPVVPSKPKSVMSVISQLSKKSVAKFAKPDPEGEEEFEIEEESMYDDGFLALEEGNEEQRTIEEDDTSLREKIESQGSELIQKKETEEVKEPLTKSETVVFENANTEPLVVVHTIKRRKKKKKKTTEVKQESMMHVTSGSHSTVMMKKSNISSIRFRPSLASQSFLQVNIIYFLITKILSLEHYRKSFRTNCILVFFEIGQLIFYQIPGFIV